MAKNANWRYNPFTEEFTYEAITGERQTVAYIDEVGFFGFILEEFPKIEPAGNTLTVVQDIPGGSQWGEKLSNGDTPGPGEYRVDKIHETGFVEFDAADNGKVFLVSYSGKGSIVNFKSIRSDTVQTEFFVGGTGVAGFTDDGRPFARRVLSGNIPPGQRWSPMGHGLSTSVFYAEKDGFIGGTPMVGLGTWPEYTIDGMDFYSGFVLRPTDAYIYIEASQKKDYDNRPQKMSLDYFL